MTAVLTGLRAWTVQRVSAVYVLLFFLTTLVWLAAHRPVTYAQWHAWVISGGARPAMMLFFAALLVHAWVGLRDVLLDYVKPLPIRVAALAALALGLAGLGGWAAQILTSA